jgi:hypothetical protein
MVEGSKVAGSRLDWSEVREHLKSRSRPVVVAPDQKAGNGIAGLLRQRAAEIRRAEAGHKSEKA